MTDWRPVRDHEGWYKAHTSGDVWGVDRYVNLVARGTPCTRLVRGQPRSPHRRNPRERWRIALSRNGVRTDHDLAEIVLEAFGHPKPGPGFYPKHLDGDFNNNAFANLRWAPCDEHQAREAA